MRKININNPEELNKFKNEVNGFLSTYGFPYRLDDIKDNDKVKITIVKEDEV